MVENREIYPAIKTIILKKSKMLVIKRNSVEDHSREEWDIPGGKFNFGETPLQCLRREISEETNLKIYDDVNPIRVWTFFKNNGETQVVGITVLSKYKSGKIKLGDEHTQFKWINPTEIYSYKIHEGIKEDVKAVIKLINEMKLD